MLILEQQITSIQSLANAYAESLTSGKYALSDLNKTIQNDPRLLNGSHFGIGISYHV